MARSDVLKRYLDAGMELTAVTQARAEALVKDLVKVGEVQADQAREAVADLIDRTRRNSEKLAETVRKEVRAQITSLGLASSQDLDRLEARLAGLFGRTADGGAAVASAKKPAAKQAPAKKAPARKATAKKTAKKATAKKAPAKRAAAKKTTKKA